MTIRKCYCEGEKCEKMRGWIRRCVKTCKGVCMSVCVYVCKRVCARYMLVSIYYKQSVLYTALCSRYTVQVYTQVFLSPFYISFVYIHWNRIGINRIGRRRRKKKQSISTNPNSAVYLKSSRAVAIKCLRILP